MSDYISRFDKNSIRDFSFRKSISISLFQVHRRDLELIQSIIAKSDASTSKQAILDRVKRQLLNPVDAANNNNDEKLIHKHDHDHGKEQLQMKIKSKDQHEQEEANASSHEHGHAGGRSHSAIGVTLVLGFVFMLFVDQIGGKMSHRHHGPTSNFTSSSFFPIIGLERVFFFFFLSQKVIDAQSIRNKITFTTTLGLVVHAAGNIQFMPQQKILLYKL
jgi:hypothetical protein